MSGLVNDITTRNTRHHPEFSTGTKMLFNQTAAPTGWTKSTSADDVALRLVDGTVGTGGSVAFETAFASHTPTITPNNDAVSLSTGQLPAHTHGTNQSTSDGTESRYRRGNLHAGWGATEASGNGGNDLLGQTHIHSNAPASSAINLDVSYVDVIIATKD